jgi:hypothetical protein
MKRERHPGEEVEPFQEGKGGGGVTRLPGMESARGWCTTASVGIPAAAALCFSPRLKTEENVLRDRRFSRSGDGFRVGTNVGASGRLAGPGC